MGTPVPPFRRQDAIYFLAMSGEIIARHTNKDPRTTGRTVLEALQVLGVSEKELRVAGAQAVIGEPSRWDALPPATETGTPK